jgi:hypothetical protein
MFGLPTSVLVDDEEKREEKKDDRSKPNGESKLKEKWCVTRPNRGLQ